MSVRASALVPTVFSTHNKRFVFSLCFGRSSTVGPPGVMIGGLAQSSQHSQRSFSVSCWGVPYQEAICVIAGSFRYLSVWSQARRNTHATFLGLLPRLGSSV